MKGILPEPLFVDKLFLKLWILQDFSSIDSSSAAETRHAAVHKGRGGCFDHAHGESDCGDEVKTKRNK
jgi:hypothetical protein